MFRFNFKTLVSTAFLALVTTNSSWGITPDGTPDGYKFRESIIGTSGGLLTPNGIIKKKLPLKRKTKCDFESSQYTNIQKCFGAIGNQCNSNLIALGKTRVYIIHLDKDEKTCTATGGMSSASILHDMCCARYKNKCVSFGNEWPAGSACLGEWNMALVTTPNKDFKWNGHFGPYYKDNLKPDKISVEAIIKRNPAPDGKKVFDPAHCKSKTHSEVKGFIDIPELGLKPYYICGTKPEQKPQSRPKPKPQPGPDTQSGFDTERGPPMMCFGMQQRGADGECH